MSRSRTSFYKIHHFWLFKTLKTISEKIFTNCFYCRKLNSFSKFNIARCSTTIWTLSFPFSICRKHWRRPYPNFKKKNVFQELILDYLLLSSVATRTLTSTKLFIMKFLSHSIYLDSVFTVNIFHRKPRKAYVKKKKTQNNTIEAVHTMKGTPWSFSIYLSCLFSLNFK